VGGFFLTARKAEETAALQHRRAADTEGGLFEGFDNFLLFEDFSGEVIGKGDSDGKRVFELVELVGYIKGQSVIYSYEGGEP
jgi:hypothetical protein